MYITLFGGEGFIGQNLVDHLKDKYHCFSIARKRSPFQKNVGNFIKCNPYVQQWNQKSDVYIHLIDNKDYNEMSLAANILPNSHLILFSSAVIYANPESEYGIRKSKIELFYKNYCESHGIDLTILRLFNSYGYYQIPFRQGSLVANIFYNHINKVSTTINNLQVSRDFIFASDIAKIVGNIIEDRILGTYDIASGKTCTIGELIDVIEANVEEKIDIKVKNDIDVICPAAKNIIPYACEGLESAIGKTLDFYRTNNALIGRIIAK